MNIELNFKEVNPELAELVLKVADDLYSETKKFSHRVTVTLDTNDFYADMLRTTIIKVCPDISEQELDLIIERELARDKREKELKEELLEQKKELIKSTIAFNPLDGWRLAYKLCGDIDTDITREIRYSVCTKIPEIELSKQIIIVEKYIKSLLSAGEEYNNNISSACIKLAQLYIKQSEEDDDILVLTEIRTNMRNNLMMFYHYENDKMYALERIMSLFSRRQDFIDELQYWIDKYLELAENYISIDESNSFFDRYNSLHNKNGKLKFTESILDFCLKHKRNDQAVIWSSRYFRFGQHYLSVEEYPPRLVKMILDAGRIDIIKKDISKFDVKCFSSDFIYSLIDKQEYDLTLKALKRLHKYYKLLFDNGELRSRSNIGWVESLQMRIEFLKKGYTFKSKWDPIYFYDDLNGNPDSIFEVQVLQKKYEKVFREHRKFIMIYYLYFSLSEEEKLNFYGNLITECEKEIKIIPKVLKFIDEFRQLAENNPEIIEQIYNTEYIIKQDKYKLSMCIIFKKLAKYYEKKGDWDSAINVCKVAISCGAVNDGTKSGMIGRKERLIKKQM